MPEHVIIDGNNLLYAMHAHAPLPHIGRETLVRVIDRWARLGSCKITLVFDGPTPRGGLSKQMTSSRIAVRFSAPATADDVIIAMVECARDHSDIRVVTSDKAIAHEARRNRCRHTNAVAFVAELFPSDRQSPPRAQPRQEKPQPPAGDQIQEWIDLFDIEGDQPLTDLDAMSDS